MKKLRKMKKGCSSLLSAIAGVTVEFDLRRTSVHIWKSYVCSNQFDV